MALVLADRVQETTATTGTGTLTLGGAVSGYQSFAVVGNGNTCYYTIVNGSAWEVGIGTYSTTGPTLARTTVLSNSNGNTTAITLVGASSVFLTYPAEKSVNLNADGVLEVGSPINYSDTDIIATFASTVAGYNQMILQNKSSATNASANFNVSNDTATDTTGFAELGINSSTFSNGAGAFNIPGAAYLASASTDLSIGTYGAYNIHFATNSSTTDSMTIFNDGGISLGGYPNPGIGNISANKFVPGYSEVTSAGGTTVFTAASNYYQRLVGTANQTFQLPDATTLVTGTTFVFDNDSTGTLTIKDGATTTIDSIPSTGVDYIYLISNSTVAGTWVAYSFNPSNYDFTSGSANFGGATISNAIWNGTAIAGAYGGTGLTTFGAANNALYSTGTTTLTAGTLPVAAGGTGVTTFTSGYIPYGNGTSGLSTSASLQFNGTYLVVGGTAPLSGATNPIAAFSSTANNYVQTYTYNANTGTSASSDFVAYANNSTDAHGWADIGFTGSNYADSVYTVTGPNEAYVFGSALNSSYTGNLVYATDSTGSANAHQWYVGGFTQLKSAWKMQLTSTGLQLANALATSYGGTGSTSTTYCSLTTNVTGTLPIANGGTALTSTPTNGQLLIGNGTNYTLATITAGSGISVTNGAGSITIAASGSGVTSVSGTSPVVSSGGSTPAISLASGYGDTQNPFASKTANYFLAAPNGSAGAPTFRAIVAADIPTLNQNTTGSAGSLTSATWQRITGNAVDYGSYGSIGVSGSTNSYAGISFSAVSGTLMMQAAASGFYYSNSTWRVYWDGSGNQVNTGNVTAYSSDERLKYNVKPIQNARKLLRQVEGVYFDWDLEECNKWDFYPPAHDMGLLAQRVQKINPYAVHPAPFDHDPLDGGKSKSGKDYLTVQYEKMVPMLIQSSNEHDELIDEMQARIDKLEALVAKLMGQ